MKNKKSSFKKILIIPATILGRCVGQNTNLIYQSISGERTFQMSVHEPSGCAYYTLGYALPSIKLFKRVSNSIIISDVTLNLPITTPAT